MSGDGSQELMAPTVSSFAYPWDPYVKDSGGKGYYVEWPYYQKHSGRINRNGYTNAWYSEAQLAELDKLGAQVFLLTADTCDLYAAKDHPAKKAYVWDSFSRGAEFSKF